MTEEPVKVPKTKAEQEAEFKAAMAEFHIRMAEMAEQLVETMNVMSKTFKEIATSLARIERKS